MSNNIPIRRFQSPDTIIRQAERAQSERKPDVKRQENQTSFREILEREVTFSKHANLRTQQRNIHIGEQQLRKLENAVGKAREKGIKDALIVMENSAFIVNAGSNTVVTVMDREEMKENVFTNIDGALFV
jgi:flagellar operon protein